MRLKSAKYTGRHTFIDRYEVKQPQNAAFKGTP